jgi:hypothetical protein
VFTTYGGKPADKDGNSAIASVCAGLIGVRAALVLVTVLWRADGTGVLSCVAVIVSGPK